MKIIDDAKELPSPFGSKTMDEIVTDEMAKLNKHVSVAKNILQTLKSTDLDCMSNSSGGNDQPHQVLVLKSQPALRGNTQETSQSIPTPFLPQQQT